MKINSLSLILLLSVLLLATLSFAAVQAGQIIGLQNGLETYQERFEELAMLATDGLEENDQQLAKLSRELEETKRQQEHLLQSCGDDVQQVLFVRRIQ